LIGQIGGPTQAVAAQGKYAYVGVGQRLIVLDVSNPSTPLEVGSSAPFADFVRDIAISGTVAYVATGGSGLHLLNVSDPIHPAEIGSLQVRGYAEGVAVLGTTVCLADGPYGLRVIDVSNPAAPAEIGSAFTRNYAFKVAMDGQYAYVAAAGAGLLIVDLTNPAKPSEVATLATPGYAYGLAVSGNTVYVAGGWGGLLTVDVTTKATPLLLGQYQTGGWAKAVSVSGNLAYVAAALSGLLVVDVSNPAAPAEVVSLAVVGGDAAGVAVAGTTAYVADRNWGLEAVSVSAPASPVQVGFYGPLGFAQGVTVAGNYAYVTAGNYGLRIVDISDPTRPRQVGAYDTQSYANIVVVIGNFGYVGTQGTGSSELHVLDISDPTHVFRTGFFSVGGGTRDMIYSGEIVYIATEHGLLLIDVSDPAAPKQLSFLQIQTSIGQSTAVGVALMGTVAFVSVSEHGLVAVDVSNPASPAIIGSLQWPNAFAQGIVVEQGTAFIADTGSLTVVDISNPRAPVWLASYPTSGFEERLALSGTQVFVANGAAGLSVIDVSNPTAPALDWSYKTPDYANSVFVSADLICVADSSGGLVLLGKPGSGATSFGGTSAPSGRLGPQAAAPHVAPDRVRPRLTLARPASALSGQTASSCVVTSTADNGAGTLRDCLTRASSGTTITFDSGVFPPSRPATIAPLSPLGGIWQGNLTIDASNAGVILDGSGTVSASGLLINSDGNIVMGLQIVHFSGSGIGMISGSNNRIGGSRNRGLGLVGEGNLISANGNGILVGGSNPPGLVGKTTITGNLIGTDITGTTPMGNQGPGIFVFQSPNNRIGGNDPGERNVVSGNLSVEGITIMGSGSAGNSVLGNYIGIDASGTKALSNGDKGIGIEGGTNGSLIQGNVVVSTGSTCVVIYDTGTSYNTVVGNYLNTDASGKVALGSAQYGINVGGSASYNRIGGTTSADRNVIAQGGVNFGAQDGPGNLVIGNFIGTDVSGSIKLAGSGSGVGLGGGSDRPFIGGTTAGERNVISGNPYGGITVGTADYAFIGGNYVGTDASGLTALGNEQGGVVINQGTHIIVQGNLIAENSLYAGVTVSGYSGNTVRQNWIYDNQGGGIGLSNGANAGISPPVVTGVGSTVVSGTACPGCEVEVFSDSDGEGQFFEGSTIAGVSGAFKFTASRPLTGPNITATATDSDGNTSQFSSSVAIPPPAIAVAPATLGFAYSLGAPVPATQSIQVTNSGGGVLNWSAASNAAWLSARPASGTAPSAVAASVLPTGLAVGTYTGIMTISAAGIASQTVTATLTVSTPVVSISAVASAASPQSALVPGSLANATGKFGPIAAHSAPGAPLPSSLGGLSLQIGSGVQAPLLYASAAQVYFQIPWEFAGQSQALLTATLYGGIGAKVVPLALFAPAIFSVNGQGTGQGVIVDSSHELLSPLSPAIAGATNMIIYCAGLGSVKFQPATGAAAPASPLATTLAMPAVTIGGVAAPVTSASLAPGYVGVYQIAAQVPASAPIGNAVPVVISIGGATSNTVTVAVRAAAPK
jgi:uncharacterized protein (TIGR03437 family)